MDPLNFRGLNFRRVWPGTLNSRPGLRGDESATRASIRRRGAEAGPHRSAALRRAVRRLAALGEEPLATARQPPASPGQDPSRPSHERRARRRRRAHAAGGFVCNATRLRDIGAGQGSTRASLAARAAARSLGGRRLPPRRGSFAEAGAPSRASADARQGAASAPSTFAWHWRSRRQRRPRGAGIRLAGGVGRAASAASAATPPSCGSPDGPARRQPRCCSSSPMTRPPVAVRSPAPSSGTPAFRCPRR
jgi:hypothetical protein